MLRPDDFLTELVGDAKESIREGYYRVGAREKSDGRSLAAALGRGIGVRVIAEVKFRSPAEGRLTSSGDAVARAKQYELGGASAISVLTEPKHFLGSIHDLSAVKESVEVPVIMKDIVVDPSQLEAAKAAGADAVLLIKAVFDRELASAEVGKMIAKAHSLGLEVLLEAHTEDEYAAANETDADVVGINNRDMRSLEVSLETSKRILAARSKSKRVVCESGIRNRTDALELHRLGADAVLVGSALMKSRDPRALLRELIG